MATSANRPAAPKAGRLDWLEPTKGLAIFMVVAYHATLYLPTANVDTLLGRGKVLLELFPMPAFFLIAGMFAARHAHTSLSALWRRRLLPLLYLYVVWSVVRTVFYLLLPGLNGGLGGLPADDPLTLPLILVWPTSSYWFLHALFLFTLFRWLIARFAVWVQLGGSALLATAFTSGLVDAHNVGWNRVGGLFFFFVLGAVYSRQIRDLVARARLVHLVLATAVVGATTLLIVLGFRWVPFLALAGQVAAVAGGIVLCTYLLRLPGFGFLNAMGRASLKIYLLHLFVIVAATGLIGLLEPDWPRWVDVLVQLTLSVATVFACFGLARLTSRVRWLWAPPAFLRGSSRSAAKPKPQAAEPGAEESGEAEAGLAAPRDTTAAEATTPPTEKRTP